MKVSILYRSMTGHSKKLAKTIGEEFNVEPYNIKKNPNLTQVDLLFIVGGVYSGKSLPDMLAYAKTITQEIVKSAVLITSSASNKCGQDEVRNALIANGVDVLDEYRCYGNFLFIKLGHPNKNEILEARKFAKAFVR